MDIIDIFVRRCDWVSGEEFLDCIGLCDLWIVQQMSQESSQRNSLFLTPEYGILTGVSSGKAYKEIWPTSAPGAGLRRPSKDAREGAWLGVADLFRRWSRTVKVFIGSVIPSIWGAGRTVDFEEMDDISESSAPSAVRVNSPVVVVEDLFFLGSGGRTFPGSSPLNLLWRRAKSP